MDASGAAAAVAAAAAAGDSSEKDTTRGRACCRPLRPKTPTSSDEAPTSGNHARGRSPRRSRDSDHLSSSGSGGGRSGGSGIKASGIFLAFGLVLEVAATRWAFRQSAQAGALAGGADGTAGVAVAALAVALSGQAAEAAAGIACLKNPPRSGGGGGGTALLVGAAAFEALGVVAVAAALLLSLPSLAAAAADSPEACLVWGAVASAVAGVLMEAIPAVARSDRDPATAGRELPYLGASGHALLWLGVAALEVLVALFLVREAGGRAATAAAGQRKTLAGVLKDGEMVGLVAVEAVALLTMWIARGLWTRARLLLAVKGREGPSRRRSSNLARLDSV